jgi:hypothetical protein
MSGIDRTITATLRRPTIIVVVSLFACARPTSPDVVKSDPVTTSIDASPPPAPLPSPSPSPSSLPLPKDALTDVPGFRICEPTTRCGFWSGCVWLERIGGVRYRALGGSDKGQVFVRRHDCSPADGGLSGCAVYCRGTSGGGPCVDGLHPEMETCTESAPPRPISMACPMGDGICGSLM